MRQQYHHRVVDAGFYIRDVNKLMRCVPALPVVAAVPLAKVGERDEALWFGGIGGNMPACGVIAGHAKLTHETDRDDPVLLCPDERVIDGMHRICKAYMQSCDSIDAIMVAPLTVPDYIDKDLKELPYD